MEDVQSLDGLEPPEMVIQELGGPQSEPAVLSHGVPICHMGALIALVLGEDEFSCDWVV